MFLPLSHDNNIYLASQLFVIRRCYTRESAVGRIERTRSNRVWGDRAAPSRNQGPLPSSERRRETIPNWIILVSNNRRAKLKYREPPRCFASSRHPAFSARRCYKRSFYVLCGCISYMYVHVSVEVHLDGGRSSCILFACPSVSFPTSRRQGSRQGCGALRHQAAQGEK